MRYKFWEIQAQKIIKSGPDGWGIVHLVNIDIFYPSLNRFMENRAYALFCVGKVRKNWTKKDEGAYSLLI